MKQTIRLATTPMLSNKPRAQQDCDWDGLLLVGDLHLEIELRRQCGKPALFNKIPASILGLRK